MAVRQFARTIEEFELPGGELTELEISISYSIGRYVPATRDQPAEGGEVDDVQVEILRVLWHDARDAGRKLTTEEAAQVAREVEDMDELDEWCREHANNSVPLSKADMYEDERL